MKHASPAALDQLEPLIGELRKIEGFNEKARGVFYRRSRAFLHFHEDPKGLFADVRLAGDDFDRFEVTSEAARAAFLARVREALA